MKSQSFLEHIVHFSIQYHPLGPWKLVYKTTESSPNMQQFFSWAVTETQTREWIRYLLINMKATPTKRKLNYYFLQLDNCQVFNFSIVFFFCITQRKVDHFGRVYCCCSSCWSSIPTTTTSLPQSWWSKFIWSISNITKSRIILPTNKYLACAWSWLQRWPWRSHC